VHSAATLAQFHWNIWAMTASRTQRRNTPHTKRRRSVLFVPEGARGSTGVPMIAGTARRSASSALERVAIASVGQGRNGSIARKDRVESHHGREGLL
jgi:hypothetical protein